MAVIILALVGIVGTVGFIVAHNTAHKTPAVQPSPAPLSSNTEIYGIVTVGGCAGPVRLGGPNNCSSSPAADMLVSATNQADHSKFTSTTDSNGYFRMSAEAGTYVVDAHPVKQNAIASCPVMQDVAVKSGAATKVNFSCDNGER